MILSSEIENLDGPAKFFDLASAYLDSSIYICQGMIANDFKGNFSRSRVVLSLTFHSVELFYKGAIFKSTSLVPENSHNLLDLKNDYKKYFPEKDYIFTVPFDYEVLPPKGDMLGPKRRYFKTLDQQYRYHLSNKGNDWEGLHTFAPDQFLLDLKELNTEFKQITPLILGN